MLIATLPGVAVTYNGEEIGMEDGDILWEQVKDPNALRRSPEDFRKYCRDFCRTPFHWDDTQNAGFNKGAQSWLPVSPKYIFNNLAAQNIKGLKSHFSVYQDVMKLRKSDVLKYGGYNLVSLSKYVIGLFRKLEGLPGYLFIFNKGTCGQNVVVFGHFEGISTDFRVVVTSSTSSRYPGDKLKDSFQVGPSEALVLIEILTVSQSL